MFGCSRIVMVGCFHASRGASVDEEAVQLVQLRMDTADLPNLNTDFAHRGGVDGSTDATVGLPFLEDGESGAKLGALSLLQPCDGCGPPPEVRAMHDAQAACMAGINPESRCSVALVPFTVTVDGAESSHTVSQARMATSVTSSLAGAAASLVAKSNPAAGVALGVGSAFLGGSGALGGLAQPPAMDDKAVAQKIQAALQESVDKIYEDLADVRQCLDEKISGLRAELKDEMRSLDYRNHLASSLWKTVTKIAVLQLHLASDPTPQTWILSSLEEASSTCWQISFLTTLVDKSTMQEVVSTLGVVNEWFTNCRLIAWMGRALAGPSDNPTNTISLDALRATDVLTGEHFNHFYDMVGQVYASIDRCGFFNTIDLSPFHDRVGNFLAAVRAELPTTTIQCFTVEHRAEAYAHENHWTLTDSQDSTLNSGQNYVTDYQTYSEPDSCLHRGTYHLTCSCAYGDGWHGGFVRIGRLELCRTFNSGSSQTETIVVDANGIRRQ